MVKPTAEQASAIEAVRSHGLVKLEALAGTGKTTTLELIARELGVPATYVTFNRRNAVEARRRFPDAVDCRTAHSLAYAAKGRTSKSRRKLPPPTGRQLAELLRCQRKSLDLGHQRLDGVGVALLAWETLGRYIKSPELRLVAGHLPSSVPGPVTAQVADAVLPLARRLWADLESRKGRLPVSHDAYLKMWQLTRPTVAGDIIFFDEAQDADPVMLDVVRRQGAKQVYVGDRYQAIYEWRGAVNAMEEIITDITVPLTQSFRFDGSIAAVANEYLAALGATIQVTGAAKHRSRVGPSSNPDVVLCRTNAEAIEGVIDTLDEGEAPALVGGAEEFVDFADAADRLQQGKAVSRGPLMRFRQWSEVVRYAESEPEGQLDLVMKVRLVEKFGARRLLWALRRSVDEGAADRTFSTAHKAKGREWAQVQLASDFDAADLDDAEALRLLYVANTRARHVLDRTLVTSRPKPYVPSPRRPKRSADTAAKQQPRQSTTSPRANGETLTQRSTTHSKSGSGPPRRKGKRWTATEDSELVRRYRDGEHPDAIANKLQRTKGSVTDRLIKQHGVDWRVLAELSDPPEVAPARPVASPPSIARTDHTSRSASPSRGSGIQSRPSIPPVSQVTGAPTARHSTRSSEPVFDGASLARAFGLDHKQFIALPVAKMLMYYPEDMGALAKLSWVQEEVTREVGGEPWSVSFAFRLARTADALQRERVQQERLRDRSDTPPEEPNRTALEQPPSRSYRSRPATTPGQQACRSCGLTVDFFSGRCGCS